MNEVAKGLASKLMPYSLLILVGVGFVGSGLRSVPKGQGSAPSVDSEGPSETAQAVMDNQAQMRQELELLRQQVHANSPDALQKISTDRVLQSVDARFDAFDDRTYTILEQMDQEMAAVIYLQVHTESQVTGKPIELILSGKLNHLKDRSFAVAQAHSGRVNYANQDMVDTVSGQIVERMAIAHLLDRVVNGQMPTPTVANIGDAHMFDEGLSKALFEMQAQGIQLTDAAPDSRPASSVVSEEVTGELANYEPRQ